jgi:hypothetical protein
MGGIGGAGDPSRFRGLFKLDSHHLEREFSTKLDSRGGAALMIWPNVELMMLPSTARSIELGWLKALNISSRICSDFD